MYSKPPFFSAPAQSLPGDGSKAQTPLIISANYKRRKSILSIIGTRPLRPDYRNVHIFTLFVCSNICSLSKSPRILISQCPWPTVLLTVRWNCTVREENLTLTNSCQNQCLSTTLAWSGSEPLYPSNLFIFHFVHILFKVWFSAPCPVLHKGMTHIYHFSPRPRQSTPTNTACIYASCFNSPQ